MTRVRRAAIAATLVVALGGTACNKSNSDKSSTAKPGTTNTVSGEPAVALKTSVTGVKVGMIISSGGPGADVKDLASGAYVAAFRLNDAKPGNDKVQLVVEDDNGTADGATAAVKSLVDQGVVGIVYASTGEQLLTGAAAAAQSGVTVVYPYADDARIVDQGATSYLAAPTVDQSASKLANHIQKAGLGKVALIRQAGTYGDEGKTALTKAGLTFASDTPLSGPDGIPGAAIAAGKPDAVVIWTEPGLAVAAADSLSSAGYDGTYLFGDRVAVPSFGKGLAASLAPPVSDGALSAGSFAGPDMPTAAADAFYLAKARAVSSGAVTADLGVADFRSHDAVLALVKAAEEGASASKVGDAIKGVSTESVPGAVGAPSNFANQFAFGDDNVALLTYSNLKDGSDRYPTDATAGGHWLAVSGSFSPPAALKGLDNPYGG